MHNDRGRFGRPLSVCDDPCRNGQRPVPNPGVPGGGRTTPSDKACWWTATNGHPSDSCFSGGAGIPPAIAPRELCTLPLALRIAAHHLGPNPCTSGSSTRPALEMSRVAARLHRDDSGGGPPCPARRLGGDADLHVTFRIDAHLSHSNPSGLQLFAQRAFRRPRLRSWRT